MGQDERDLGSNGKQFKLIVFRTMFGSTRMRLLVVVSNLREICQSCSHFYYYMCYTDYLEVVLEESSWFADSLELLEPLFMTC